MRKNLTRATTDAFWTRKNLARATANAFHERRRRRMKGMDAHKSAQS
jgi:hypothetical protein